MQLSQLVDMYSPAAVLEEVKSIFVCSYSIRDFADVRAVYRDFLDLYGGRYPGYCACNTRYHDTMHITDSLLAMARLIDGYNLTHKKLPVRLAALGLIAALLHDTGFIQNVRDRKGTGAKYTLTHVNRSIEFAKVYFLKRNFSGSDARIAANALLCTDLLVPVENIKFRTPPERTVGLMLGSADLLGQMASRCYLERLLFLYREFREGHVAGYSSELEMLRKTLGFSRLMDHRLAVTLENMRRYVRVHFKKKYGINRDLYRDAIRGQLNFLENTVLNSPHKYRKLLRRTK